MIEVKNVTKVYGKKKNTFTALKNVNLTIPDNTSVAILGKSGSGKSTLMHAISGLDKPQEGEVLVDGEDILRLKARATDKFRANKMAFIFQSFFVEGGESCYDNVSLSLETAGVKRSVRKQRIEDALTAVDLADKIKSRAQDLSGGQKQRLAIARAIVGEPEILFADEPTGNLDSATSKIVEDLLFDYQKNRGATLIIVTHDEELASRCQMIVRIKDGEIIDTMINSKATSSGKDSTDSGEKFTPKRRSQTQAKSAKTEAKSTKKPAKKSAKGAKK